MEFVVRKEKRKSVYVPHTSDYSDMFGEEFSRGIDLPCILNTQAETAKATEEAKIIVAERQEKLARIKKEAKEVHRKELEMARKGIKPDKDHNLIKAANETYVAVDLPPSYLAKNPHARPAAAGPSSSAGGVSTRPRMSKQAAITMSKKEISERSRKLKERILAATGGAPKKSAKRSRSEDGDDRSPVPAKRRRTEDNRVRGRKDDRSGRSRETQRRSRTRSPPARRGRQEERGPGRDRSNSPAYSRGYNSEEWSDRNDSDSDGSDEDLFDLEALEREEARTTRYAKMEDKNERLKEKHRREAKEQRRIEFENSHR